jgi:hypothetical protein
MRMTCDPPLLSRRNVSTKIAKVRDSLLAAVAAAKTLRWPQAAPSRPRTTIAFTKGAPRYFHSSPGVRRGFCENCGSPLTYENERIEGEIHIYAASLLDANYASPNCHVFVNEQLAWFEALDDLPRFATTRRDGASPIRIGPKKKVD